MRLIPDLERGKLGDKIFPIVHAHAVLVCSGELLRISLHVEEARPLLVIQNDHIARADRFRVQGAVLLTILFPSGTACSHATA